MKRLIYVLMILSTGLANAQSGMELLPFEDVLGRLLTEPDTLIVIENKQVDLGNYSARKIQERFPDVSSAGDKIIIDKSLTFRNCEFTGRGFRDFQLKNLTFENSRISSILFMRVDFNQLTISGGAVSTVKILNSDFANLNIENITCAANEDGDISVFKSNVVNLSMVSCQGHNSISVVGAEIGNLKFDHNNARIIRLANNQIAEPLNLMDERAEEFAIRKNIFLAPDSTRHLFELNCERLVFLNNVLFAPTLFTQSKIATRVDMADNEFKDVVDLHVVSLPEFDKYMPFYQFEKGLVVYKNIYGEDSPDGADCYYCELYNGETDEELGDKTNFDKLVHSYEILFLGYKATGDIESANAAYVRIKDLYMNRLRYLYRTYGGFKHYFRWKLAQLLKVYTNHGTDPALSIVISIYVILAFAVFYFFFPSEWDVSSKARLISDFKEFMDKNDKGRLKPFLSMIFGFAISIVNAITLSLNSFVTLGFGTIPTTGAARYVCIIQGFIGWFLLSIFTVSLINQILF